MQTTHVYDSYVYKGFLWAIFVPTLGHTNIHFHFSLTLLKKKVLPSSLEVNMNRMISSIENALCWTVLAPLARMNRERRVANRAREQHDKRRIDVMLSAIVATHSDLLA